jgi:hypothetical protein
MKKKQEKKQELTKAEAVKMFVEVFVASVQAATEMDAELAGDSLALLLGGDHKEIFNLPTSKKPMDKTTKAMAVMIAMVCTMLACEKHGLSRFGATAKDGKPLSKERAAETLFAAMAHAVQHPRDFLNPCHKPNDMDARAEALCSLALCYKVLAGIEHKTDLAELKELQDKECLIGLGSGVEAIEQAIRDNQKKQNGIGFHVPQAAPKRGAGVTTLEEFTAAEKAGTEKEK